MLSGTSSKYSIITDNGGDGLCNRGHEKARVKKVLVVEDSIFFGVMVKNKLQEETAFDVTWVKTMAEAVEVLQKNNNAFFAAILDFNLPDAPRGEIIDEVVQRGIPGIVFTGDLSEAVRENVWAKKVADYALKDNLRSLDYIVTMLKRFEKNETIKVLVTDDSNFFRKILTDLLRIHRYNVFSASDGKAALDVIAEYPDIKLVITDYNMPKMDGFTLTQKLRKKYSKDELAIIGISAQGDNIMAARFIKSGANDFLIKKSFLTEEFYCRVTQNIEILEHINKIKEAAIKDFLTGLYNRRYFFNMGEKLFADAVRKNLNLTCTMIDIDYFKKINDTYGHDAGDLALKYISVILKQSMCKNDIVARMGGEEFCVLSTNMDAIQARQVFEDLRRRVETSYIDIGNGKTIHVTISMGVITKCLENIDDMVNQADMLLYKAKESGRNRVIMDNEYDAQ